MKKTVVVHSPYDSSIFYNRQWHRQAGSLLFVGRLVSDKGVHILLQAFAKAKKNYDGPLSLCICGDGPAKAELESYVAKENLQQFVQFKGIISQEDAAYLMNTHQVLIVPSIVEPFGTVVPEGLACGGQIICSNSGGLPEAAGQFATIVPAGEADILAEQIVLNITKPKVLPQDELAAHLQTLSTKNSVNKLMQAIHNSLQP